MVSGPQVNNYFVHSATRTTTQRRADKSRRGRRGLVLRDYFTNAPALAVPPLLLAVVPEEDMEATRRSMSTSPTVGKAKTAPLCSSTLSATSRQAAGFWKLRTCSATESTATPRRRRRRGGRGTACTQDKGEFQHSRESGGRAIDKDQGDFQHHGRPGGCYCRARDVAGKTQHALGGRVSRRQVRPVPNDKPRTESSSRQENKSMLPTYLETIPESRQKC